MLEIRKITDDKIIESLKSECAIDFHADFAGVFEGGKVIEFAAYSIIDEYVNVHHISYNTKDFALIDGLIKTLIFYADLVKARYLILEPEYERFAKAFNFERNGNNFILDIYKQNKTCNCDCRKDD